MPDKIWVKVKALTKKSAIDRALHEHQKYKYNKAVMFDVPTWNVELELKKAGKGIARQ